MLIAVIGDCDGNHAALLATLDAIANEGILSVFQTGNLAGPSGADRVIALLREYEVSACQGDFDRLLLRFEQKSDTLRRKLDEADFARLTAAHGQLSSAGLEFLRSLHKRVERSIEGVRVYVCHGSPASQSEVVDADSPYMRLQRHREEADADIIICGGSREPFHRWVDGTLVAGPGQLVAGPGVARFLLVSTEVEPWDVSVREVPFATSV